MNRLIRKLVNIWIYKIFIVTEVWTLVLAIGYPIKQNFSGHQSITLHYGFKLLWIPAPWLKKKDTGSHNLNMKDPTSRIHIWKNNSKKTPLLPSGLH